MTSATTATATTIQDNGRHPCASAWIPPMTGPAATPPKSPRPRMTDVRGSMVAGNPDARGGTAAIRVRLVLRPCTTWPAANWPGVLAPAARTEPTTNSTR